MANPIAREQDMLSVPFTTVALVALAAGAVFGLLAYGSIELTRGDGRLAAVWVPNALAVACLLRWRFRFEPLIFAGLWLGNSIAGASIGDGVPVVIGLAASNIVEISLAVMLVRTVAGPRPDMAKIGDLAWFVALACVAAPAVSATLAMLILGLGSNPAPGVWLDWFIADGLGMMLFAPAALIIIDALRRPRWLTVREVLEWTILTIVGAAVTFAVFLQTDYPLLFLIAPVVIAHAYRLGALGTACSVTTIAIVATGLTWAGRGPINLIDHSLGADLFILQAFLACAFLMGLPVAAVLNGQRRLAQEHRDRATQLRLLADNITDAVLRYDANGICTYASPSVEEVLGMPPDSFVGQRATGRTHSEAAEAIAAAEAKLVAGESEKERFTYRRFLNDEGGEPVYIEADAALTYDPKTGEREGIIVSARNVTHRVLLERQLVRASRHAENAAIAKAQFLANMSHEIRTPMNGVLGFAELLLKSGLTGEQRKHAELIDESGKSMMRLLNDILDISKMEAGHVVIQHEPLNLRQLITNCIKLHAANAARKGLELRHGFGSGVPATIVSDPLRLRQIVLNLLGNAIKFTEAGAVTIEVDTIGDEIELRVQDSGIGIDPDRLEAIFEPFEQADKTTSRRFGGTGLGLAISRQLAELLGGSLDANSEVDQGSCFILKIPLSVADSIAEQRPDFATERPQGELPPPASILLAEDHDINRILVTAMLERCGQRVTTVEDGNVAVATAISAQQKGEPFDLVLMDVQMPLCDGYAATRALRAAGLSGDDLPIIALTANAFEEDIRAALESGMQAHLAKPLVFDDLAKALLHWLPERVRTDDGPSDQSPTPPSSPTEAPPSGGHSALERKWQERRSEAIMAVSEALRRGALVGDEADELARIVHKLAGTAGSFGENELGERARAFEHALRAEAPEDERLHLAGELLAAA